MHAVPGEELADLAPPAGNLHQFRWDQALGFARWLLGADYPEQVQVWLIEGASFAAGDALTPVVAAAVDRIASLLAAELGERLPDGGPAEPA